MVFGLAFTFGWFGPLARLPVTRKNKVRYFPDFIGLNPPAADQPKAVIYYF